MPILALNKLQQARISVSLQIYRQQINLTDEVLSKHIVTLNDESPLAFFTDQPGLLQLSLYLSYLKAIYFYRMKQSANTAEESILTEKLSAFNEFILVGICEKKQQNSAGSLSTETPLQTALFDLLPNDVIETDKVKTCYQALLDYFSESIFSALKINDSDQDANFSSLFPESFNALIALFYQLLAKDQDLGELTTFQFSEGLSLLLSREALPIASAGIVSIAQASAWGIEKTQQVILRLTNQPAATLIAKGYISNLGLLDNNEQLRNAIYALNEHILANDNSTANVTDRFNTNRLDNFLLTEITRCNLIRSDVTIAVLKTAPQSVLKFIKAKYTWLVPVIVELEQSEKTALLQALQYPEIQAKLRSDHHAIKELITVWSVKSAANIPAIYSTGLFSKLNYLYQLTTAANSSTTKETNSTKTQKLTRLPITKYELLKNLKRQLNEENFNLYGLFWFEPSGIKKIRRILATLTTDLTTDEAKLSRPNLATLFAKVTGTLQEEQNFFFKIFRRSAVNDFYTRAYAEFSTCTTFDHLPSAYAIGQEYLAAKNESAALICFNEALATEADYPLALYEASRILYDQQDYTAALQGFEKASALLLERKNYLLACKLFHEVGIKLYEAKSLYFGFAVF